TRGTEKITEPSVRVAVTDARFSTGVGDPRWHALWAQERDDVEIQLPDGRERRRVGGMVWVTGRHIRDAVLGVLIRSWGAYSIDEILAELEDRRVGVGS